MTDIEKEYIDVLASDPGDELFVDYGELLRRTGRFGEALIVTLRGLSHSPDNVRARLLLARIYFELGCTPFAVREVRDLHSEFPERKFLRQLLIKLAPDEKVTAAPVAEPSESAPQASPTPQTVAESEFDFEALEELEEKGR